MSDVTIRKSDKNDHELVEFLCSQHSEEINYEKKKDRLLKSIGSIELLVAEIDGEFGGFMYAYFKSSESDIAGDDQLHISAIVISPNHQRQGVASSLVKALLGKTSKPITAHLNNENYKAIGLFTSLGFRIIEKQDGRVLMAYQNII